MIILITSCAPKVEVDKAKPVEEAYVKEPEEAIGQPIEKSEEVIEKPKETAPVPPVPVPEEPEETALEETIEISDNSFSPNEKTVKINTKVTWVKKDKRDYKIACYLESIRVVLSPTLKDGDSFTYTFLKEGEYSCITTPYGMRSTIEVVS